MLEMSLPPAPELCPSAAGSSHRSSGRKRVHLGPQWCPSWPQLPQKTNKVLAHACPTHRQGRQAGAVWWPQGFWAVATICLVSTNHHPSSPGSSPSQPPQHAGWKQLKDKMGVGKQVTEVLGRKLRKGYYKTQVMRTNVDCQHFSW